MELEKQPYLKVHAFYLKDPLKSFSPSNRQYLADLIFGPIEPEDIKFYQKTKNEVEALIPLSWWDKKYIISKYQHFAEY